jgi:DNA polymerase (family 10)
MDRKSAAKTLREIGRLLEVSGDNPYRVRAFLGASRAVERAEGDFEDLVSSGRILDLKGVGKGTAAVLADLVAGRRPPILTEIDERVPPGVREILSLPGLGPKKVRTIWQDLGVETPGELEYACRENRLVELKGFGPASQASVLEALDFFHGARERRLLNQAWERAENIKADLLDRTGVSSVQVAGELRRWSETVARITLVVGLEGDVNARGLAESLGDVEEVAGGRWLARSEDGIPVELWLCPPLGIADALIRATGSDDFVSVLKSHAPGSAERDDLFIGADERAVFESLGLPWVPPELRWSAKSLDVALTGGLPELVDLEDVRGVLHNHTTDSDGAASLEEMAAAARDRGWEFFGVADHSPAAFYANGVDANRLRAQWTKADAWNAANPGLRIVKGLEADIMPDGRLDLPDGCEEGLEYVVASVHSSFRLSEEDQTRRIIAAVGHPACRVLGHPTGRLLLARSGYDVDLERVFEACSQGGVAVEINASPYRLDLDARWARRALECGLKLVVNPDAHSVAGLDDVRWGIAVARRAGATKDDLVNCMNIEDFLSP